MTRGFGRLGGGKSKAEEDAARKKRMDVQREKYRKQQEKKKGKLPKIRASGRTADAYEGKLKPIMHYKDPKTGVVHAVGLGVSKEATEKRYDREEKKLERLQKKGKGAGKGVRDVRSKENKRLDRDFVTLQDLRSRQQGTKEIYSDHDLKDKAEDVIKRRRGKKKTFKARQAEFSKGKKK